MRSRMLVAIALLSFCLPAFAKKEPELHPAKVISQNVGSSGNGVAVVPLGNMVAGVPINRRSDIVVVETGKYRLTLSEVGRNFIVLPVNDTIQVYQDRNWIIVLDSQKKKHRFVVVHMEAIGNETHDK